MDEKDSVLLKAREGRSAESIEAEHAARLKRGQQIESLKQLLKTPEWKVFYEMVEREELEKSERLALDPNELVQGIISSEVVVGVDPNTGQPMKQVMPSPVDGSTWQMKRVFYMGVAWGIRNAMTFPERAERAYTRMLEAQERQRQLQQLTGGRAPISGIDKNPVEGGS